MLKFKNERSDRDLIYDKAAAALETGNPAGAREVLAEYAESFPDEVESIRSELLRDYNVAL